MTDNKKINRRDAIKLISAAAGASVVANLPSKWSKPELASAAMPVHAQASCDVTVTVTMVYQNVDQQLCLNQGPAPAQQIGDINIDFSSPTCATTGNILSYQAIWTCQTGCLQLFFNGVDPDNYRWAVSIATPGSSNGITFSDATSINNLVVDLSTGEYQTDFDTHSTCSWISTD